MLGRLGGWLLSERAEPLLARLPAGRAKAGTDPSLGAWAPYRRTVPTSLQSTPGIRRDREAEDRAHATEPLHDFHALHGPAITWILKQHWHLLAPRLPRMARVALRERATARVTPASAAPACDPAKLTADLRRHAAAIGLSAVGIAAFDSRYHYVEHRGRERGDRVVVGLVEQSWAAVQRAPSPVSERSTFEAQTTSHELMVEIAHWLHARGYAAAAEPGDGYGIVIHYAVQAGLGQLGLNGQLLTPQAGSRCRPTLLTTDAPLELDAPRDFGLTRICDACQVCVRRCPTGAIPARRWMSRGVEKAKINVSRCLPVMGHAFGCAICMKVCPIQRYGLERVTDEFERSGTILGKGTDELEGYRWPVDGRFYGSGRKPPIPPGFTRPPDLPFDPPQYRKPANADDPPVPPQPRETAV